jgi:hypothetical protein
MTSMDATRGYLQRLGLAMSDDTQSSSLRFPDGGQYRVEIPSTEGPDALEAVVAEAAKRDVPIHRVSQGSGVMLQTDDELLALQRLGRENDIEVSLFTGPRGSWGTGVQATSGSERVIAGSLRGADQLVYGIEDVKHACDLGLRSVLVADVGQLWVLGEMKQRGDLPADLVLKVSVSLPVANPATAHVLEEKGATTLNLPVDLTLGQIAAIRQSVSIPLDIYIEGPDDFGGPVRYYEISEVVRVASPVYLKFTVRNSPGLYPSGGHLRDLAISTARERVRRAEIGLALLRRYMPEAVVSPKG